MKLRDYQVEALEAIEAGLEKGIRRPLVVLPTGCHAQGQKVLMHDGRLKKVEEIRTGDRLMGPDSSPRIVTQLIRNHGEMVRIIPVKGEPFEVNLDHVLTLRRTPTKGSPKYWSQINQQVIDVTVREWLTWSKTKKHEYKLWRTGVYFHSATIAPIDPYFIGLWLGDGSARTLSITTADKEVVDYLHVFAKRNSCKIRSERAGGISSTYHIIGIPRWHRHKMGIEFRALNLFENKHIPHVYKTASTQERLRLLAGLMDSDGSLSKGSFDYISKSKTLADDVAYVARSVGFAAYVLTCEKTSQNGTTGTYHRVSISGDTNTIPTILPHKQAQERAQAKRVNVTGFSVEHLEEDNYYGFTLNRDGRYLLDDFTVTHNSGKTVVFSQIPKQHPGRMLVLAHRQELLTQAQEKIKWANPELSVEIEQGQNIADIHSDVVIASTATLGRSNSSRLEKFHPQQFRTIVVDEAHHAAAPSYKRILDYFVPELQLGVTATPQRGDKTRLTDAFDEIVYFKTIQELIEAGYLSHLAGYRIRTSTDISGVTTRSGDWAEGELSEAVNNEERNRLAVEAWRDKAHEKKTVVFCVDVQHAKDMAETFNKAEIATGIITGAMKDEERSAVLSAFRTGDIKVLANCMVLTEGFDEPSIEAIILARPTQSQLLYTQIVGRGTRLHPGKERCIIIDLADATSGKKPMGLPTLMGLPPDFDSEGEDLNEVRKKFEELEDKAPAEAARVKSVNDIKEAWERIDLFMPPPPNQALMEYTSLIWMETGQDHYILNMPTNGERIHLRGDALGRYTVSIKQGDGERVLGVTETMEEAFKRSDRWIHKNRSDQIQLLDNSAQWREDGPSEKQVKWLKKFGVPITSDLTKGQASMMLDKLFAENPKPKRSAAQEYMIRKKQGW